MTQQVLVIGAGFGGIAAALRMKALGFNVSLLERLPSIGGRAQAFNVDGFKHDAGPTVITAPYLFDELFSLFLKQRKDYAEFVALDTWYDFYFHDGKTFSYRADLGHTLEEIRRFDEKDVNGYLNLLSLSEKIFNVGYEQLADKSFTSIWTMVKQIPALLKLKSLQTVSQLVGSFIKNKYLRQVFTIHPLLVGGNPHTTTSIYTLIHYLERKWGIHFCIGGTGALVNALETLMQEEGIDIKTNTDIEKMLIEQGQLVGVQDINGNEYRADYVIFNGDPPAAYKHLLPSRMHSAWHKPEALTKYSMGLYVLFFGSRAKYSDVAHHTIWLGPRYKELLEDIFDTKVLADDFSLYLHRPTATDTSFAPEGCDSFYALCPVPNLQGDIDWSVKGEELKERILSALDDSILPDICDHACSIFWMTPEDFKKNYKSEHGAGFSIAPVLSQSAYFRYHNQDDKYKNLFFVGAGTHPGAGLPGVLSSAKVVENIFRDQALCPL